MLSRAAKHVCVILNIFCFKRAFFTTAWMEIYSYCTLFRMSLINFIWNLVFGNFRFWKGTLFCTLDFCILICDNPMWCHVCLHFTSLLLHSDLTHVKCPLGTFAKTGNQKSIDHVHAHFFSPLSSRLLRWFSFVIIDRNSLSKQVSLLTG